MAPLVKYPQLLFVLFLALALGACAMAPQTPKQTMAATYVAIESIADTTLVAYQAGEIDRETVTDIYRKLREAKGYVDLTSITAGGELSDSDKSRLEQARDILVELEALLQEKTNE